MTTRIDFATATPLGQLIVEAVDLIIEGKYKLLRAQSIIDSMTQGTDWAFLEGKLSIVTGSGRPFSKLIDDAVIVLNQPDVVALKRIDQG